MVEIKECSLVSLQYLENGRSGRKSKKKNPEGTRYCRLAREPQNSKGKYELLQFGDNVKHNK